MYKGIDISAVQGSNVDFTWLKNNGQSFVINRCYVGNEGRDGLYPSNMQRGKDAGLYMAAYNFIYPLPNDNNPQHKGRDPLEQAQIHFDAVGGLTEQVAVDAEWPQPGPDWQKWGVSAFFINDWVLKYLERYTQLSGRKPLVYTYPFFAKAVNFSPDITQYPLWIASYTNSPVIPNPFTDWAIWQNSGGTQMKLPNGIPVDTDIAKDLSWFGVVEQAPTPEPTPTVITQPTPEPEQPPTQLTQPVSQSPQTQSEDALNIIQKIFTLLMPLLKKLLHIR